MENSTKLFYGAQLEGIPYPQSYTEIGAIV